MKLPQIGHAIRAQRISLGLSQQQLGDFADLSRVTINQLENGTLDDLGFSKLNNVLDTLGITMETKTKKGHQHVLTLAAQTASTSYKAVLTPGMLKKILQTGDAPKQFEAHIMTLLDETPTSIVLGAVKEAVTDDVPAKKIMKHLSKWAKQWHTNNQIWA